MTTFKTAYKASNYWKLISDYIRPFPKIEKVHRVINQVNDMRK